MSIYRDNLGDFLWTKGLGMSVWFTLTLDSKDICEKDFVIDGRE